MRKPKIDEEISIYQACKNANNVPDWTGKSRAECVSELKWSSHDKDLFDKCTRVDAANEDGDD